MARIKRGVTAHARHKKTLKLAKGYYGARSRLFRSAAEHAGAQAVATLLTGMGSDGARGMQALRAAGARTLAESEESCVVYGMPQEAVKLGAVDKITPLETIADKVLWQCRER